MLCCLAFAQIVEHLDLEMESICGGLQEELSQDDNFASPPGPEVSAGSYGFEETSRVTGPLRTCQVRPL